MRRFRAVNRWLVLPVIALLLTAGAAEDEGGEDGKALQGTWQVVSSEIDGEKQAEDEVKQYTLVVSGGQMTINKSGDVVMKGPFKLDPGQTPRHLDFKLEENPNNPDDVGKTLPGIYQLSGDELKWCFSLPARTERPKGFKSEAGSGEVYATLKREKK